MQIQMENKLSLSLLLWNQYAFTVCNEASFNNEIRFGQQIKRKKTSLRGKTNILFELTRTVI
jgi:hypothetical protein